MRNHAKYFEKADNVVMRLVRLFVACFTACLRPATLAAIGLSHARSYAKVFRSPTTRHCTGLDTLSRLSRLRLKKSGQRKPNEYAVSRLSRLVPTVFNMYRHGIEAARCVWRAGRELKSRHKNGLCNATVQHPRQGFGSFLAFLLAGQFELNFSHM